MGFLKRVFGGDPAPEWTPFPTGRRYRSFITVVEADLRRRGHAFRMEEGVVEFEGPAADVFGHAGLGNLAQLCNQIPDHDWPGVIAEHFDALTTAVQDENTEVTFEHARPLLKPRIYRLGDLPDDAKIVSSRIGADLIAVLSYDLPTSVRTVSPDEEARWAVPIAELFEIAIDNLAGASDRPSSFTVPVEGAGEVHVLQGDSFFTASEILRLHTLVTDAPAGALAAVPNRHTLLYHPIVDAAAVLVVQPMIQIAAGLYREGPGSISSDLLWWHDGALTVLPSTIDKSGIKFFPPDAFLAALEKLPNRAS